MPNALLSVYHKDGLVDFARALHERGWVLFGSSGTYNAVLAANLPITNVAKLTGREPILKHRVVTLSGEVHGGLLATEDMLAELESLGLPWIDLCCVDFYPIEEEIARPGATRDSVLEKTDIGGPAMVRSGAKGRRIVICDPQDRTRTIEWLDAGRPDDDAFINGLCAKAEGRVANYGLASASFHSGGAITGIIGTRALACSYGENPWQTPAGFYATDDPDPFGLQHFTLVEGEPSYNILMDVTRCLQTMRHIAAGFLQNIGIVPPIAVAVKHGNACGAGVANDTDGKIALLGAVLGDPTAIFGGTVMTNFAIDADCATALRKGGLDGETKRIVDCVVAPAFSNDARDMLHRPNDRCRMLVHPGLADKGLLVTLPRAPIIKTVPGGFLLQPNYTFVLDVDDKRVIQRGKVSGTVLQDLVLAWAVGSTSNSNTITLAKSGMVIANAVGQQDRRSCCRLAIQKAYENGHDPRGSAVYSDSFFPFIDGPRVLIDEHVAAVFAASGSVRDDEVISAFEAGHVAFWTMPNNDCRGFFWH